jgi:hypothetical protein
MKHHRSCFLFGFVLACGSANEPGADTSLDTDASTASDGSSGDPSAVTVTYHRDVRPLIERHCVSCHSAGNIGPFELTSYEDVYAFRDVSLATIEFGTMPPWGMTPDCGDFVGDPSLSDEDKALFATWVAEGAHEGDPGDYVAPTPLDQPELSRIDLTLQLPEPYEPQLAPDDYRCFVLDWPQTETVFITGTQFEPDNTSITHHAIVYLIAPEDVDEYDARDAAEPGPGYTCFGGLGGNQPLDFIRSRWLTAWAPGTRVGDLPAGTGLRVDPGSKVVIQMHYNTLAANGLPDRSTLHYKLDSSVEREAFMMPWVDPSWLAGGMTIPAGTDDTVHAFKADPTAVIEFMTDIIPPDHPLEVFSTMHHMHRRGSRGYQAIARADGTIDCLVDVPRYDYAWQMFYVPEASKIIRPGDELLLECQWDNRDGDQSVGWGDGTDDEMCLGVHYITAAP